MSRNRMMEEGGWALKRDKKKNHYKNFKSDKKDNIGRSRRRVFLQPAMMNEKG